MSIYVSGVQFGRFVPGFFERFIEVIADVFSHFASHLFHESSHAPRIILVNIAERARIREGFQAGFLGLGSGKPGHDPFEPDALAKLACR
jgi:hypothetical protein